MRCLRGRERLQIHCFIGFLGEPALIKRIRRRSTRVKAMGDVVHFRLTKKGVYRAARREMERMYQMTYGGEDPIASDESRELFELGLVEEVQWVNWETYCSNVINRIFEGE